MLVKQKQGHKSITSTQIYVQLLQTTGKEEYISKVVTTLEEMKKLIEQGFEYVCEIEGEQLFRKGKT